MPARKLVPEHPCPNCQQPTTNSSTCSDCNKAITAANKKRRESRREAGNCPMYVYPTNLSSQFFGHDPKSVQSLDSLNRH